MKRTVVLFDIDGTLVHAGAAAHRAFVSAFREAFGAECGSVKVQTAGRCDPAIHQDVARAVFNRLLSEQESETLRRCYLSQLESELRNEADYRVLPGVSELCATLARRTDVLLGLQTGNLEDAARLKLTPGNLAQYFAFGGYGCDSIERGKVVGCAIARAGQVLEASPDPQSVIVLGDTPHDIAAGKAHGCITVAVATGIYDKTALQESSPDLLLEDLTAMKEILALLA